MKPVRVLCAPPRFARIKPSASEAHAVKVRAGEICVGEVRRREAHAAESRAGLVNQPKPTQESRATL